MKNRIEDSLNKSVSVFGASGFVGSHFSKKSRNNTIEIPRNQRYPESNEILYLIGTNHNYNVYENIYLDIDTNLRTLIETLEETRLRKPTAVFNYISSWFVYGSNEIPFKESQCCKPNGFYSITKYAGELLLRSFCETYNLKFRIIRLGNIVGPGDKKASLKKNAVQFMTRKILNGEDINLYEGGEVIRDFLHIDDAVRGIDLILEKGALNEIYNLSSGVGVKVGDILREFRALVGSNSKFNNIRTPDFHNRVQARNSVLDITKVMELGFEVLRPVTGKDFLEK